jgi:ankyrin repeat domain-containing protein 50
MSDCKDLLLEFLNLYPKTSLILDALDECERHKRTELIETFDYFVASSSRPVKIFISSRPDGDIRERFKNLANIEIQAMDNRNDISKFVNSEITRHRRWNKMPLELQKEIIETLQERSQGM